MAKLTPLDRAILATEEEIAVLQAAVNRMKAQREQMTVARKPRAVKRLPDEKSA